MIQLYAVYKGHILDLTTNRLEVKGQEKVKRAMNIQKRAGKAIRISDNIDYKTKITGDKGDFIMIKESIYQEDITLINLLGESQNTWSKN